MRSWIKPFIQEINAELIMQIFRYFLALATSPILTFVLTSPLLAQKSEVDPKGKTFDAIQISLDGRNLFTSCRDLSRSHLTILRSVRPLPPGGNNATQVAEYQSDVRQAEEQFLAREATQRSELGRSLRSFLEHALKAPDGQLQLIPVAPLRELCAVAIEPQGPLGLSRIPAALESCAEEMPKLEELAAAALRKSDEEIQGPEAERDKVEPLDEEAYRRKRERWEARQREEEILAEARERIYAESLRAQVSKPKPPRVDPKVGYRKDLPAAVALPPPKTPVEWERAKAMNAWHQSYVVGMTGFKFNLAQWMSRLGPKMAFARRESCGLVYESALQLKAKKTLDAPDPEVRDAALAMIQELQTGAMSCLESDEKASKTHLDAAQKELDRLAAALLPYSLAP